MLQQTMQKEGLLRGNWTAWFSKEWKGRSEGHRKEQEKRTLGSWNVNERRPRNGNTNDVCLPFPMTHRISKHSTSAQIGAYRRHRHPQLLTHKYNHSRLTWHVIRLYANLTSFISWRCQWTKFSYRYSSILPLRLNINRWTSLGHQLPYLSKQCCSP